MHAHNYVYEKVEMEKGWKVRFSLICTQGFSNVESTEQKKKTKKIYFSCLNRKIFSISYMELSNDYKFKCMSYYLKFA